MKKGKLIKNTSIVRHLKNAKRLFFGLILALCLTGCFSGQYNYIQDTRRGEEVVQLNQKNYQPKIQIGQELCITVYSVNEDAAQYFRTSTEREGATGIECLYYMVDEKGQIKLPLRGEVKVVGKTLLETESLLGKELATYLIDPKVTVKFQNFSVSVMGDVALPGVIDEPTGKISVIEAIARAGDITQFGKKSQVTICRERGGIVQFEILDLTSKDFFTSPYFYLEDRDIVMVESNVGRIANSKNMTQWGSVIVGIFTFIAIIVTSGAFE